MDAMVRLYYVVLDDDGTDDDGWSPKRCQVFSIQCYDDDDDGDLDADADDIVVDSGVDEMPACLVLRQTPVGYEAFIKFQQDVAKKA